MVADLTTKEVRCIAGVPSTWRGVTAEECVKRFNLVRRKDNPTGGSESHEAQRRQIALFKDLAAKIDHVQVCVQSASPVVRHFPAVSAVSFPCAGGTASA